MYLLRVVFPQPTAKIPNVEVPAADPPQVLIDEAVATALVSPEYVYLLRVVVPIPNWNIPTVEFPAADP
jgi:hypothetical protein